MPVPETLLPWLPALPVIALTVLALAAAAAPATRRATKWLRLGAIAIMGVLALAATIWQGSAAAARIALLTRNDRTEELTAQVKTLEGQVAQLKQSTRVRSLPADTATKLADYLRAFGSRKIVVSCAPNDIEAYSYATDIANVLKAANWDARGPETTAIFGDVRAMGINVYDNDGHTSDTAKILRDGLTKFAIPYQSRVPPNQAIPDGEAVELFIGTKPQQSGLVPGGTAQ
jgi:hypothetical protein